MVRAHLRSAVTEIGHETGARTYRTDGSVNRGPRRFAIILLAFVAALCCPAVRSAPPAGWSGIVVDQAGAVIPGAEISLISRGVVVQHAITGSDGTFTFSRAPLPGDHLTVHALHFENYEIVFAPATIPVNQIRITLLAGRDTEHVTVSAAQTASRLGDTAASVVVLDTQRLADTAAVTLDDALRQVPGLSLFRRSGSRTTNPTAQGVSLRGTGASGASRALVLVDGVPLNDPFGGWVYWNRVPREAIDRVEILRGGASDLYGSSALGGVIDVFTRRPTAAPLLSLSVSAGSQSTADSSLFASVGKDGWSASISAADFSTDGYILVDKAERGSIDTPATSRDAALDLTVARTFQADNRFFIRAADYGESRRNGTPLQINRTHLREFATGLDWANAPAGSFTVRIYGGTQVFDQTFTSVNTARTAETLTRLQRSPSLYWGLSVQWSRAIGTRQAIVAGMEATAVRGSSDEIAYTAGRPTALVDAGGKENETGFFLQDVVRITPRFFLTVDGRYDRWRNYDASTATSPLALGGLRSLTPFADRRESAFSPHVGLLVKLSENSSIYASASRAFRAPTLNELYRSFRVGNVLTQANENLRAERLSGGEAGISLTRFRQRLFLRGDFYFTETAQPIANVTITVTPNLITRQRQNLGSTRSAGVELDAEAKLNKYWTVSGGYLLAHATVSRFPADRTLEGLWIPQVARQQVTFQARFGKPSLLTLAVQGRFTGLQFEDDQNLLRLDPFFALDALASRRIRRWVELFVAGENLTGQRYSIGRTPVRTIGPPLFVRAGLKLNFGR